MSIKIVAVNAGPRKGRNTDTLINEAIRGAACCCFSGIRSIFRG